MSVATAERVPMFASFGLHNYRLFWTGGFVSNIGTWMATSRRTGWYSPS